ncbi:hypothetical protein RYA05_03280 [Pseudomonas syringae pv. actinidiae]|nr:hypothetical protein [Pseudomonas syringae pv. actinidiae]
MPGKANWNYTAAELQLQDFEKVHAGWDGEGSLPVKASSCEDARALLAACSVNSIEAPTLTMDEQGSVALVWSASDYFIAADCPGDGRYAFAAGEGAEITEDGIFAASGIHPQLLRILRQHFSDRVK